MYEQPDHEFEILEDDQTVPPRPEELIADAGGPPPLQSADQSASGALRTAPNAD